MTTLFWSDIPSHTRNASMILGLTPFRGDACERESRSLSQGGLEYQDLNPLVRMSCAQGRETLANCIEDDEHCDL